MSTSQKFRASHLKLDRASRHLEELQSEIATYMATEPVGLAWEDMPPSETSTDGHPSNAGLIGLVPRMRIPIPESLAPVIGDVVHNLRSALDIMMFDLISDSVSNDKLRRRIAFPFWEDESKKPGAMRCVEGHPVIASLVEAWEPYPGGRSRLYALHELWNQDKHRSIIPTVGGIEFSHAQALTGHLCEGEPVIDPFPARKLVRDGQPYTVTTKSANTPPLGELIPCVVRLALDGDAEIKGRDLVQELDAQSRVVRCVLESFATGEVPRFLPPPAPKPARVGPGQLMFPPTMTPEDVEEWLAKNWRTLV